MNIARRIASLLVKRPKTILLAYIIITLGIGLQIQNLYMQSDFARFLPADDPTLELWNRINQEFGIGETILIYVEADDIRDPLVLREMERVSRKINIYDLDRGEQDGIYSVRSIAEMIKQENAKPVLPGGLGGTGKNQIPDDPELISRYISRILIQETEGILFVNTYTAAVIVFQLSQDADYISVLNTVKAAIAREARYSDMTVTGTIALQYAVRDQTLEALTFIFPLAALFVAINLFIFHRTLKGLVIGFFPLGCTLLITFGILGLVQPEMTILSIAVVALLFGLGVDYSIYLANRFAEEHTIEDKIDRVEQTLGRTGTAVLLCAITTVIAFGSLMTSPMPPMVTFGFGCFIGISFAFISAILLVPCLCLLLKFERKEENHQWKRFASFVVDYRKRLFVIACFFVILSLVVLPQVRTDVNFLEMAPEGIAEVDKLLEYSQVFGGGANFNVLLVETDNEGLTYPEVIEAIYQMEEEIRQTGASVVSIAGEIKKINDVLDRSQILEKISGFVGLQQLLLDKVAENGIVDSQYSKTIIVVSFPADISLDSLERAVDEINRIAASAVIPYNGRVSRLVGQDVVTIEVNRQLLSSQTSSLFTALLLVLACLILGFGSSVIGFFALLPVLFVLSWEPGSLVMLDIPLSIVNITIASIMTGIGIDYSVQINQRFKEERQNGLSKVDAMRKTIETTGLSLLAATCTTISALLATFLVNISMLHEFSLMVIVLVILSFAAAVCVLPTLLTSRFVK